MRRAGLSSFEVVMGFLDRFKRKSSSAEAILRGFATPSRSGVSVTADSALRQATVYACVAVLSESIAQLPCMLYRRLPDGGKERATDHPLYPVLHHRPNEWQTAFEFWEMVTAQIALYGNAYALIIRSGRKVLELLPLQSNEVKVTRNSDFSLSYDIPDGAGRRKVAASEILHLRYRTLDGFTGLSPIAYNRETVGFAIAATEMGASMYGNGANVSGVLSIQGPLSPESIVKLREAWHDAYHGISNTGKTAVLDNGAVWNRVSMSPVDAQYIEARKFQRGEIAAIYRIPPHKIGDLEHATFSNIEHQSIEFVTDSLTPWLRRYEQAVQRDLLIGEDDIYCEFLVEGLLRGDSQGRAAFYKELSMIGALSVNEIRDRENLNRIGAEGDARYVQSNMMPLGAAGPVAGSKPNA